MYKTIGLSNVSYPLYIPRFRDCHSWLNGGLLAVQPPDQNAKSTCYVIFLASI